MSDRLGVVQNLFKVSCCAATTLSFLSLDQPHLRRAAPPMEITAHLLCCYYRGTSSRPNQIYLRGLIEFKFDYAAP